MRRLKSTGGVSLATAVAAAFALLTGCAGHKPAMPQTKPVMPQALTETAFLELYESRYPCETADPRAIATRRVNPWTGEVSCTVQRPLPDYCGETSDQGSLPNRYVPVWLLTGGINEPNNETHIPVVATPEAASKIARWNNTLRQIREEAGALIWGLSAYNHYPFSDTNRPDIGYNLTTVRNAMSNGGNLAIAPGEEGGLCSFVIGANSADFVFPGVLGTSAFYVTATTGGFVTSVVTQTADGNVSFLEIPQGDHSCLQWPENFQRNIGSQAGSLVTRCLSETLGKEQPSSPSGNAKFLASLERQLLEANYATQGLPECCPPDSCKAPSGRILGTK